MIIATIVTIYVLLGLTFIVSLAFAAAAPAPNSGNENHHTPTRIHVDAGNFIHLKSPNPLESYTTSTASSPEFPAILFRQH